MKGMLRQPTNNIVKTSCLNERGLVYETVNRQIRKGAI